MNAITPLAYPSIDETDAEQRQRILACTRELTEINMQAAHVAGERNAAEYLAAADPALALSRATRGVVTAINTELQITRSQPAARLRATAPAPCRAPPRRAPSRRQ